MSGLRVNSVPVEIYSNTSVLAHISVPERLIIIRVKPRSEFDKKKSAVFVGSWSSCRFPEHKHTALGRAVELKVIFRNTGSLLHFVARDSF